MSQPIAPELWQEGIDDFTLLPGANLAQYFTGQGIKFANVGSSYASATVRVWDLQISSAIFTPDTRRLNGLKPTTDGRDGWGASYYGVAQDVRFDWRYYKMGRERSNIMRLWKVEQYDGEIGNFGNATSSSVITNGENLIPVARQLSVATKRWQDLVLHEDVMKYSLFAALSGHVSGRWLDASPNEVFDGNGQWIAQPGTVQGESIPPRFAPIHCIEFDKDNLPAMLQNIKVTWNNLRVPENDRCIVIDPFYEIAFMQALWGAGIPVVANAYTQMEQGTFTKLMGWDIYFDIPTQYWPALYVDANLNVVHTPDGTAAYDAVINSVSGGTNPDLILQNQLIASDRMIRNNFINTEFDAATGTFKKVVYNYPLGQPGASPYYGVPATVAYDQYGQGAYPWSKPGAGYGLNNPTGPVAPITRAQVIGMFLYKKAVQMGQQYSEMHTYDGDTICQGPFTVWAFACKFDCWVVEQYSAGIIPIIDTKANGGIPAIHVVTDPAPAATAITSIDVAPATVNLAVGAKAGTTVTIIGTGKFDTRWTAVSGTPAVATVDANGVITAKSTGTATITFTAVGDSTKTDTVAVTVA